ncbi:MAG: SRPBCC domain-containing protein, partial [Pseudomonadota bacterium]
STTNDAWEVIENPMMPDWPRVLLTTVEFEALGPQTRMTLRWAPHDATEAEVACFRGALAGLDKGWGAGMDLLADLLAELQGS